MGATKSAKLTPEGESETTYHFSSPDLDDSDLERLIDNLRAGGEVSLKVFGLGVHGKRDVKLSDDRWYAVERKDNWSFELTKS